MNFKDKKYSDYYTAKKIADETIEVLENGEKYSDKYEYLNDFIENNSYSEELLEKLKSGERISEIKSTYRNRDKERQAVSLDTILLERESKRYFKIVLTTALSLASAVAAIFILIYSPEPDNQIISVESKESVINVPTLLLGNGENINLDDEQTTIVNEQYQIDKSEYKKILYKSLKEDEKSAVSYNTIIVPSKYTYTVAFEDGSEVLLNANSELRYPTSFEGDTREVFLRGEGYFTVAKSNKPFIVTTEEVSVKVYGTEFNVNTHIKNHVETVLISGSVGVTIQKSDVAEVMMTPNQLFSLNIHKKEYDVVNVDTENYIAWKDDMFKCDDEKLYLLLDKIEKWYGVTFEYNNKAIRDILVSLKMSRTTKLENIISAVEKASGTLIIKKSMNEYVIE